MPGPSGAIVGWRGSSTYEYISGTHSLTAVGSSRFVEVSRNGPLALGPLDGSNYWQQTSARALLSGATTWGMQFKFLAFGSISTGPQVLSIGSSTSDAIVYRILSNGGIRAIINDSIFTDSSASLVSVNQWYVGALTFETGVLKAYVTRDGSTTSEPSVSIANSAGDFPLTGGFNFGVGPTSPTFLPFSNGVLSDIVVFNYAPRTFPVKDTGPVPYSTGVTSSSVFINWPLESGVNSYAVYYNTSNDSNLSTFYGSTTSGVNRMTVGGLQASTNYYFWTKNVYSLYSMSDYSISGVLATTSAATITSGASCCPTDYTLSGLAGSTDYIPRNLAIAASSNSTTLTWSAPTKSVSGYRVYRAFDYTQELQPIGYTTNLNYIDSGVETNRTYYYRITSIY